MSGHETQLANSQHETTTAFIGGVYAVTNEINRLALESAGIQQPPPPTLEYTPVSLVKTRLLGGDQIHQPNRDMLAAGMAHFILDRILPTGEAEAEQGPLAAMSERAAGHISLLLELDQEGLQAYLNRDMYRIVSRLLGETQYPTGQPYDQNTTKMAERLYSYSQNSGSWDVMWGGLRTWLGGQRHVRKAVDDILFGGKA